MWDNSILFSGHLVACLVPFNTFKTEFCLVCIWCCLMGGRRCGTPELCAKDPCAVFSPGVQRSKLKMQKAQTPDTKDYLSVQGSSHLYLPGLKEHLMLRIWLRLITYKVWTITYILSLNPQEVLFFYLFLIFKVMCRDLGLALCWYFSTTWSMWLWVSLPVLPMGR